MQQYEVTGMSCAACSARVEKAVSRVVGVDECSVNLLTNTLTVKGNAEAEDIISAVKAAGYGIKANDKSTGDKKSIKDTDTPRLAKRLGWSALFLAILMYASMGHAMWGWRLPYVLENNPAATGLCQLIICTVIMVINQRFFVSGFKAFMSKSPNMDTLVALGSGASYVYSIYGLFSMIYAQTDGNMDLATHHLHGLYFESAAMILTLITVGKLLEAHSKGKTTSALEGLYSLAPKTATVIINGEEKLVPVESVAVGDTFVVRPGDAIPVDGEILYGSTSVNEASLTGESIPVDKAVGDSVSAGTNNLTGYVRCRATHIGEDTTLSQIIRLVNNASSEKAPISRVADRVSGVFVPVVIVLSLITLAVWLALGQELGYALSRCIAVLVISCPCALGLATPVAIMVGNGVGAKNAILFKTATALEQTGRAKTVVLDKTGTITKGTPEITDIIALGDIRENELLQLAYSLESRSEHPLATAICNEAKQRGFEPYEVEDFNIVAGNGLEGIYKNESLRGGNLKYIQEKLHLNEYAKKLLAKLSSQGKTPIIFSLGDKPLGIIAVADVIKEDSRLAVESIRDMNMAVVMLTGDNEATARAIANEVGIDAVVADVLPTDKEQEVKRLQKNGSVIMVGDGINDAPALTRANVGIAIGTGTDIAIDSADVVLMKNSIADVVSAIRLSRATLKNIYENLFWAFIYNIIGIPIAAGVFVPLGLELSPMLAAAAMSLSSFCVVTNALRLNTVRLYKKENIQNGGNIMEKTMKIEGMMCGHCSGRVKQSLEAIEGVKSAEVSHETGVARLALETVVADDVLKKAVEEQGYTVLEIK